MTLTRLMLSTVTICTLAACANVAPPTPVNQNFNNLRASYPDLSAVEFDLLDENDDGFVDATEAEAINNDNDPDGLDISDD